MDGKLDPLMEALRLPDLEERLAGDAG